MDKIEVRKVELVEGEELQGLVKKVIDAIGRSKGKTTKSIGLTGIYKDHIITRDFESGKFFKMAMERDDAGNVKLGDAVEVKQVFVPAKQKTEKAEDAPEVLVAIDEGETAVVRTVKCAADVIAQALEDIAAEPGEMVEPRKESLWQGVLD